MALNYSLFKIFCVFLCLNLSAVDMIMVKAESLVGGFFLNCFPLTIPLPPE